MTDKVQNLTEELERKLPPKVVYKEKEVPFEKCKKCDKTALEQAKKNYEVKAKKLNKDFKNKLSMYEAFLLGLLMYSSLVTMFTALKNKVFLSDFSKFLGAIYHVITSWWDVVTKIANWIALQCDKIPQKIIAFILHWLGFLGAYVVLIGVVVGFLVVLICKLIIVYKDYDFADVISFSVAVVSLAIIIFFGQEISNLVKINLVLLFLIVQALYIAIRSYVRYKRNQ